ncbi:MAG: hypothetical protein LBN93_02355 [Candidatus Symbiothrix sp.]|jgi:hypothetical protein|nr:hypothetical protein [Candidatus Symbiothrix sp.]
MKKMNKNSTLFVMGLTLISCLAYAQAPVTVTGKITVGTTGQLTATALTVDFPGDPTHVAIENNGSVDVNVVDVKAGVFENSGDVNLGTLNLYSNTQYEGVILPKAGAPTTTVVGQVNLHKTFYVSTDGNDVTNAFYPPYPIAGTITYEAVPAKLNGSGAANAYDPGNIWLFAYDGAVRATNQTGWTAGLTSFSATDGGYAVQVTGSGEYVFPLTAGQGGNLFVYAPNQVTVRDYTTTFSDGQAAWNLTGSPFAATLSSGTAGSNLTLSANPSWNQEIYYLGKTKNGEGKQGWIGHNLSLDGDVNIPPYVSFFVQAPNSTTPGANQNFVFAPDGLDILDANPSDFRSAAHIDADVLRLTLSNAHQTDKAYIVLGDQYKNEFSLFDGDATKFDNGAGFVQLWSVAGNETAEVNTLTRGDKAVQLGVALPTAGDYTIQLADVKNGQNFKSVVLEDKGVAVADLLAGESYTFNAASPAKTDRFVLRIDQSATGSGIATAGVYAYVEAGKLFVNGLTAGDKVSVYTVSGQLVASSDNYQPVAVAKGVYLVKVTGSDSKVLKVLSK